MNWSRKKLVLRISFCLLLFSLMTTKSFSQQRVKKVIFQGFWWDYWNNNYRFKWADYLTDLAPRLKALGVDAIWIPPNIKNDGPGSVGYMPFDHYDIGDKMQKGETLSDTVRTRSGNKDELLRMIAVMHANGIEVIQDIVLNHSGGAGNRGGNGGRDFNASSSQYTDATNGFSGTNYYKNFRYVSYSTPHLDTSTLDYWTRNGRWAKNLTNFYPNPNNNSVNTNDINKVYFGPDMAYESTSIGRSFTIPTTGTATINGITKSYFNPNQSSNYMAQNAKDWIVWYKKQTGADGFRWDAVKHFGFDVQRDLTYALKYQSGFANGGNSMFNVGEWVGTTSEVDYYAGQLIKSGTPTESGVTDEQMSGGFDFGLRGYGPNGGIYSMVMSQGSYNMQNIPSNQQTLRYFDYPNGTRVHKTVPFVNSHDTYRPNLSTTGNYSAGLGNSAGWNTGQELGGNGQHIDPREPRFAAANAIIAAVDGNPCFYIEDVFDYFSLNKRWSHLPTQTDSLPLRADVANIMQCHQALNFKDGNYAVPTAITGTNAPVVSKGSLADHLVIERTGKALIGISDAFSSVNNNTADQEVWVTADNSWPTGTMLYDYTGAHGVSGTQIFNDRRVLIKTAPCGHSISGAFGHGYSIWAPYPSGTPNSVQDLYNVLKTYVQPGVTSTTQEWELADDLGDSHCASLGQGGQLPANSTNQRVAGKIFVQSGKPIAYKLTPAVDNNNLNISLWDLDGNLLSEVSGVCAAQNPLSGQYTPTNSGWITIKARQNVTNQPAQKVWVNVTYTAPSVVNTRDAANSSVTRVSIWTGNKGTSDITDCGNWEEGKIPTINTPIKVPQNATPQPVFPNGFSGSISTPKGTLVGNASVNVKNSNNFSVSNGNYAASNIIPNSYVVRCTKNNEVNKANGVGSADALLVQRHILNSLKLNSAYKIIAADVDGNRSINSADVLRMKRLTLGTDTIFRNTQTNELRNWVFVDSSYVFPDTTNPFPFKDSITISPTLNSNFKNISFRAIKLGDVNYDWNPALAKQAKKIDNALELNYNISNLNNEIHIPVYSNNFNNISAIQTTLHLNNKIFKLSRIDNNALEIDYNASQFDETGNVSILWLDKSAESKSIESNKKLFTIVLTSKHNHSNEVFDVSINDEITNTYALDYNLNQKGINITELITENIVSVFPNPSKGSFTIQTKNAKQLFINDVLGKTLLTKNMNENNVDQFKYQLKKGVYFIKLVMQNGATKTEKLIIE